MLRGWADTLGTARGCPVGEVHRLVLCFGSDILSQQPSLVPSWSSQSLLHSRPLGPLRSLQALRVRKGCRGLVTWPALLKSGLGSSQISFGVKDWFLRPSR